ncbi:YadA-like family protein, partial [uncultured Negativicoccus sp.]
AIGAFYRPNENQMFSIGGSFGGGENMVNAGVSVKFGEGTGISTSKIAMANEIRGLKTANERMQQENKFMQQENKEMKNEIEILKQQVQQLMATK